MSPPQTFLASMFFAQIIPELAVSVAMVVVSPATVVVVLYDQKLMKFSMRQFLIHCVVVVASPAEMIFVHSDIGTARNVVHIKDFVFVLSLSITP